MKKPRFPIVAVLLIGALIKAGPVSAAVSHHSKGADDWEAQAAELETKGRTDQAEAAWVKAKDACLREFGPGHPVAAKGLRSLGLFYQRCKQYDKAEPLLKQALVWRQVAFDQADHPTVIQSLADMGILRILQERYADGEPYLKQAVELRSGAFDAEDAEFATLLNYLSSLYVKQEKYAQAIPLCEQVLAIDERVLGKDHPEVGADANNLGVLYQAVGRLDEADRLYQRARSIQEKGTHYAELVQTMGQIADLYHQQGRDPEAEQWYRKALDTAKAALRPDDPQIAELNEAYAAWRRQARKPL